MHWAEHLIGRPWEAGGRGPDAFDCWGLVHWCWRERFAIEVPEIPVDAANLRAVLAGFRDHPERRRWQLVDRPCEGDAMLMRQSRHPVHVGLWLTVDGGGVLCRMGHRCGVPGPGRSHGPRLAHRGHLPVCGRRLMPGTVVMLKNPFRPERDREAVAVAEPLSIRAWLDTRGVADFGCPTICLRNAEPVLRERWQDTLIADGNLVVFVPLPQGGGGGGKNPLRTVLMIAVMVAALTIPGAQWGLALEAGTFAHTLATVGITVVGTALVNVLLPPPKPAAVTSSFGGAPAPSPTYSLQAQGNHARLAQPIPVIYGRHRVYPDLAAMPWAEYTSNDDQHLHQLHCIGQGQYDLEQVRIEDTPIASFDEVETQFVPPGGSITLFEADVVTAPEVAGQELIGANQRDAVEDGWIGPFTVNPAGTSATKIGIDVVMPRGLYYAAADGSLNNRTIEWDVEARAVDDDGAATGGWTKLASVSVTRGHHHAAAQELSLHGDQRPLRGQAQAHQRQGHRRPCRSRDPLGRAQGVSRWPA